MAPVLLTGAAGFLGGHLARALAGAGHDVRGVDVVEPETGHSLNEFARVDVRDAAALRRAAAGCELVIDNAALVPVTRATPEQYRDVNVRGCANTLDAAGEVGAYVLHISSSAIFGVPRELPVRPATPPTPFEPYGRSKAEAERVVEGRRERGLRVGSLRPRTLLGPGRLGIFDVIFRRIATGKRVPMFGAGHNRVQVCDVDDFCAAALAALERRSNRAHNVGAADFGAVREDLGELIRRVGSRSRLQPLPVWAIRGVLRPLEAVGRSPFNEWHWRSAPESFYFDISETMEDLGWTPRYGNVQALERAYRHYLERAGSPGASVHRRPLEGLLARLLRG